MDPAQARRFRAVDGTVEEVIVLEPDLVIGGTFIAPATRGAFARLGMRYEGFGITPTVGESLAQVRAIAALVGHPERGQALVGRIEAALAANRAPAGPARSAVVWQSGGIVPGSDTLISDLLIRTGFTNAAAAQGLHQADVLPLEAMLAAPPQVIFAAGNPVSNEDRMLGHPALARLTETRRERLDPALLWCGGPTIIKAAEHLGAVRKAL
jgi:iron complex transport system substrate-binding protein